MKHSLSTPVEKKQPIMKHSLSKKPATDKITKHSPSAPPSVKQEPITKHSLSERKTTKRKSLSEINDERKKKKPATVIGSSSQSPIILDDNKQERFTKMIGGESSKSSCGICFEFITDSDMFKRKRCNHLFCVDCISKYVDSQISNNVVKIFCPTPNCSAKLEPRHLQNIMPREFIDRWEIAKYESKISLDQKTYCPFKNCSILLVDDNDSREVVTSCECPACHRLFCAQCKVPWHAEMRCWEFQNSKRDKNEQDLDDKFLDLARRKKWQRCPNCSIYVKRRSGCEHMKCRCKCSFCYHCGKKWKSGHTCNRRHS
ncbi:RBR-type E3 ubiquitin transferase [Trifolium repens]|nr:RBR-type E3 ubiquitin transferase [Trifolium repens]